MIKINQKVKELIKQMTLEEKASLCSGKDEWAFKTIDRLNVPSIWVSDGPHGLRKAPTSDVGGFGDQHPSTCFPTASALSATWDVDLLEEVGKHIAIECQALNVNIILGPGVNIKRSPLGGRNFEYFSEDPLLSGELGAAYINGVQKEGVGTSLKHFACNSQETKRMLVSSELDERTLREIYLTNFEICVKKAHPWTIMAAYNPINGVDATANKKLLRDILVDQWGFDGIVISDWVSVFERVDGVKAGLHVEMPGKKGYNDAKIVEAVQQGILKEEELDKLVAETLSLVFKAKSLEKKGISFSTDEHHKFARKVAGECMVLLKNNGPLLPLTKDKYKTIGIIGQFSVQPRFQGNGSSEVKPTFMDKAKDEIEKLAAGDFDIVYAQGYSLKDDKDTTYIAEAVKIAAQVDVVVLHLGLPQEYESEGYDRKHLAIPPAQIELLHEVAKVQKNIVVVLTNGSAVSMEWQDKAPAIMEAWLGGQAGGGAIADVLFGLVNPSGKLAETFPQRLEDTPAFLDLPGINRTLNYGEGVFVGYRWYDKRDIKPLFPLGHGLSYTQFQYDNIKLSSEKISEKDVLKVSCTVKNIGSKAGKEIVQLYVGDIESRLIRPKKELKGFQKIHLNVGEEKTVDFELNKRDFSYYNEQWGGWIVESGEFDILLGSSSRELPLEASVSLETQERLPLQYDNRNTLREWIDFPETKELVYPVIEAFFKSMPTEYQGDLKDFKIHNDFFLDMPMSKYPVLSAGMISMESIDEMVERSKSIRVKL